MHNYDIITTVICLSVPFCLKYDNVEDQNIINLLEKIGDDLIKTFLTTE
jgi:hypothetical protein